jgi:hypothetical protein
LIYNELIDYFLFILLKKLSMFHNAFIFIYRQHNNILIINTLKNNNFLLKIIFKNIYYIDNHSEKKSQWHIV